jgi:hypothetical protein
MVFTSLFHQFELDISMLFAPKEMSVRVDEKKVFVEFVISCVFSRLSLNGLVTVVTILFDCSLSSWQFMGNSLKKFTITEL